jgi:hypothetical protein
MTLRNFFWLVLLASDALAQKIKLHELAELPAVINESSGSAVSDSNTFQTDSFSEEPFFSFR